MFVPLRFSDDKTAWCVDPPDCHPSPWGNGVMAVGLLDKLERLGWIRPLELAQAEEEIAEAFRDEERRVPTADEISAYLQSQLDLVPTDFEAGASDAHHASTASTRPVG